MSKIPKTPKVHTYAFNFVPVENGTLVKRAISNDTLGVLKLEDGRLEFWHLGERKCRTADFGVLFKAITRVEKNT